MGSRTVAEARHQFSKKLAGRAEWFWFLYMVLMAALVAYRPEAYLAAILFASLVTVVMVTSVLAYTDNSKFEKALYAPNQIARHAKFNWKEAFGDNSSENKATEDEGGEDNG